MLGFLGGKSWPWRGTKTSGQPAWQRGWGLGLEARRGRGDNTRARRGEANATTRQDGPALEGTGLLALEAFHLALDILETADHAFQVALHGLELPLERIQTLHVATGEVNTDVDGFSH